MTKKEYEAIQYVTMEAIFGNSDGEKLRESVKIVENFLIESDMEEEIEETEEDIAYNKASSNAGELI